MDAGAALMIFSAQTEQGFQIVMHNQPERKVVDFDGLSLIARTVKGRGSG